MSKKTYNCSIVCAQPHAADQIVKNPRHTRRACFLPKISLNRETMMRNPVAVSTPLDSNEVLLPVYVMRYETTIQLDFSKWPRSDDIVTKAVAIMVLSSVERRSPKHKLLQ